MLTRDQACERLAVDRDGLLAANQCRTAVVLPGPMSAGLETLTDVLAHVAMWDEIVIGAMTAARFGRHHWCLNPALISTSVAAALNDGGVTSGRVLPETLVVQRFLDARNTLIDMLAATSWNAEVGALSELLNTPEPINGLPSKPYQHGLAHVPVMAA